MARVQAGSGWNVMKEITAIGDLDHDGNADLVSRDSDGQLLHYRGNGRGWWFGQGTIGSGWNIMSCDGRSGRTSAVTVLGRSPCPGQRGRPAPSDAGAGSSVAGCRA